jgi:hypothetical protein
MLRVSAELEFGGRIRGIDWSLFSSRSAGVDARTVQEGEIYELRVKLEVCDRDTENLTARKQHTRTK